MSLKLYNTKTRSKNEFKPLSGKKVGMYTCGPTVYSSAHIGNMRSFTMADILKRTLMFLGFDVKHVMNITDVGHLISETDQDKMEEAAKRENKSAAEIAQFYTDEFMRDMKELNLLPADVFPKATEHIEEQIALIKKLEEKGFTYKITDGIYFDTSKFENYGNLSRQKAEDKEEGARVAKNPEKKNITDFALWKFSPQDEQRQMEWESPWGIGFPGWHVECSAMSAKHLGQPFDIHTGAIDLIPVHHENEIAQSTAAHDEMLANWWVHGEFVVLGDDKMAKSDGNVVSLSDIKKQGFHPLSYRYFILNTHYRSPLTFTTEALEAAQNALHNIRNEVRDWNEPDHVDEKWLTQFKEKLEDDLNTPQALALMWEIIKSDHPSSMRAATLLHMDHVLGLGLDQWIAKPLEVPDEITKLAAERNAARDAKDFKLADTLRQKIENAGYAIEDTKEGTKVVEK